MSRLLSFLFLIFFAAVASLQSAEQRPNILFIIADDASRDSFGAYGSTYVKTPSFDRIAKEGVLFTQAYNCNPKCAPARACLLTGRYSWQLEEACNHGPILSSKWQFYPYLLEENGYAMGFTGKGWGPGVWQGIDSGATKFEKENPAGHPWNEIKLKPPYSGIANIDYAANFDAFLEAKPDDQPFCFWFGTKEPHRGYGLDNWKLDGRKLEDVTVPAYYPDNPTIRGDLADYAIEVEWFDTHIGRALKHLEDRGLLENTLIIATSDHGMPFPRVKGQIYDDGFHIPMAARWGEKIKPGRTVTDFITFPDLAPTLMELAGVDAPEQMTGRSFVPQLLAEGSGRIEKDRDHTLLGKERHDIGRTDGELLSVAYPARAIRNDQFLYVRNFKPDRWPGGDPEYGLLNCDNSPTKSYLTSIAEGSSEYGFYELAFGKRPEEELYDMVKDPDCVNNLAQAPEMAETKAKLWTQLKSELKAQGDPRVLGEGDIFDFYPYAKTDRQQKLYGKPDYDPVKIFEEKYGKKKGNSVKIFWLSLILGIFPPLLAEGQETGKLIYKEEPRRKLTIYYPDDWQASDKRAALVIFRCNIPFQREVFRKRGMVVIKPETAPVNSGNLPKMTLEEIAQSPKPRDQVADTKSAIRFIRANAATLGIDPQKIVATGTSGGGDLALQSHLNRDFVDPNDDLEVSPSPNALVLFCPAFDGIDIWFVKNADLLARTKAEAPAFLPILTRFVESTETEYAQPLDHRTELIALAASLGMKEGIAPAEIDAFQSILGSFNERDWQLLHPAEDALKMSASRLLRKDEPLPPTLMLFGDRDHLRVPQEAFVKKAKAMGLQFDLKIYPGGGHSFMTQPAFEEPSTKDVAAFLETVRMLPAIK